MLVVLGLSAGFTVFARGVTLHRFSLIQVARMVLWIGALSPLAYSTAQTTQTLATGNISGLEIVRGVLPVFCLVLARVFTRPNEACAGRR